jgi:membrane-bound serine protease (ClpP class)
MAGFLAAMSSDEAVVMLAIGVGLIYYELNRPGTIIAGALGLSALLMSVAVLLGRGVTSTGVALILAGTLLLAADLFRPMSVVTASLGTAALMVGLWKLPLQNGGIPIHLPVAEGCGGLLGVGTSVLTRIARRARTNKGLD